MSIAAFFESYEPTMGAYKRQVYFVLHEDKVRIYMRLTDGSKGRQSQWLETNLDTLKATIKTTEYITKEISGMTVTLADIKAIKMKGYSPVLGTKAMQAHDKASATNNLPAHTVVDGLHDMVQDQPDAIEDLVVDRRRQAAPAPTIASIPQQHPVIEIQPEVERAEASAPAPARTLQLHLATVPPKELADMYVSRQVFGKKDFEIFDYARSSHYNVLVYGPTGPGKTTGVEAWSASRGLRLAQVSGNATLEPSQLFGKFIPDGEGGFIWCDGPVTDVVRHGGVLNLDEINFISPKVYTVLYTLLTSQRFITLMDHRGEVVKAHPDLTIFATMNPGYIGTTKLNFAMRNRFKIQLPWDYDAKVEGQLVKSKSLHAMVKQLRDEAAKGTFETPISTNMLMEFAQITTDIGYDFAAENFVAHFDEEEQAAVRMVVKTHEANLREDFGVSATNIVQDQGDESNAPARSTADILSQF